MQKIFTKINALLIVVMLAFGFFLSACEKEEIDRTVDLWSFGPSPAVHGGEIKFIGANLDQVTAIVLPGDVQVTNFITKRPDLIIIQVPDEAMEGQVILKTPQGDIQSKSRLGFNVPIAVTSYSPGEVRPGGNLTITGDFMNWVKEVHFNDGKISTDFVSQSLNELVVKVPMDAKTGRVMISDGKTDPILVELEDELVVTMPTVTGMSPLPLKHGDNLTITGTDLDLVNEVQFTGVGDANVNSFVSKTANELVIAVPDNAKKGVLTLVVPSGLTVETTQELDLILPALTSASPSPVDRGANITLSGTNLDMVKSVVFGGGAIVSTFVSQAPAKIVLTVPADAKGGRLKLITNRDFDVLSTQFVSIVGDTGPNISYFIYEDELNAQWQKWGGWGTAVQDLSNAENPARGTNGIKVSYNDAYGALQLHPTVPSVLEGYTHIVLSVYGGPGSDGSRIAVRVKDVNDKESAEPTITVVEGQYKSYEIPISDLGAIGGVKEFLIKNYGTNPNTIFIDDIGLR